MFLCIKITGTINNCFRISLLKTRVQGILFSSFELCCLYQLHSFLFYQGLRIFHHEKEHGYCVILSLPWQYKYRVIVLSFHYHENINTGLMYYFIISMTTLIQYYYVILWLLWQHEYRVVVLFLSLPWQHKYRVNVLFYHNHDNINTGLLCYLFISMTTQIHG